MIRTLSCMMLSLNGRLWLVAYPANTSRSPNVKCSGTSGGRCVNVVAQRTEEAGGKLFSKLMRSKRIKGGRGRRNRERERRKEIETKEFCPENERYMKAETL